MLVHLTLFYYHQNILKKTLGLTHGIDFLYHLLTREKHVKGIKDDKGSKSSIVQYQPRINNDELATSWVVKTIKEEIFSMIFGINRIYEFWTSLKEKLHLATVEKKKEKEKYVDSKKIKSHDLLKNI